MKRISFLFALLIVTVFSAANSYAQVKLEEIIKPGSRLIYQVTSGRGNYDFVITVKDLKGSSFEWEMGSPMDTKGTIIHTDKALQSAYKMYNYFQSETKKLDDQILSVWLSQKMFKDLTKAAEGVKVCMYDPLDEPKLMKYFMDGEFSVKIDGKGAKITDKVVRPAKKSGAKWIIDPSNDDSFSYYNSASFPVILRMHTNFTSALKEIKTK